MKRETALGILLVMTASSATAQNTPKFIGTPVVDLSADPAGGRKVRLVQPYAFQDAAGTMWKVPAGTIVDGASIPRVFWTVIGGPFEGKYRDASILHDYYCVSKDRPWRTVHRMFYDAMITRGVEPLQAKIMYFAVFRYGPRWEERRTMVPSRGFSGEKRMVPATVVVNLPSPTYDANQVKIVLDTIERENPSVERIEQLAGI